MQGKLRDSAVLIDASEIDEHWDSKDNRRITEVACRGIGKRVLTAYVPMNEKGRKWQVAEITGVLSGRGG